MPPGRLVTAALFLTQAVPNIALNSVYLSVQALVHRAGFAPIGIRYFTRRRIGGKVLLPGASIGMAFALTEANAPDPSGVAAGSNRRSVTC